MEYLRTDTVSVGTLYRKAAKLSRGAGAYFCKHFVPAGAQGGLPCLPPAHPAFPEAAGGLAFFAASLPCLSGSRRGAWRFWSPAYPAAVVPTGGLNPAGTCYPCPGGEDHLKRRSSSPPVPPLLGCRRFSQESASDDLAANHGFSPGDARGEAPCIRKPKVSPFPAGRGSGGWGQEVN